MFDGIEDFEKWPQNAPNLIQREPSYLKIGTFLAVIKRKKQSNKLNTKILCFSSAACIQHQYLSVPALVTPMYECPPPSTFRVCTTIVRYVWHDHNSLIKFRVLSFFFFFFFFDRGPKYTGGHFLRKEKKEGS